MEKEKKNIVISGLIIGVIASLLVLFGNPKNMGFCIACFVRDTAGALGLHQAKAVQYMRPEIIGLVLGSFIAAFSTKEFKSRGGSSPLTRFVLGFTVAIGALMFLGCPFRMVLRLAGGDLNAISGIIGFAVGILIGIAFLNKGFSLKRTYSIGNIEGYIFPTIQVICFVFLAVGSTLLKFSEKGAGPGALHAPILISLAAGLIVGALAQRTRLCMVGGIRDAVLFKEWTLMLGFVSVFAAALIANLVLKGVTGEAFFKLGMKGQPVAHTDGIWNGLGMVLVGFASVLLGGCPLRQLVLAGEGNTDSAITVLGLLTGAAFAHNFGLASSGNGPTANGKIAVISGLVVCLIIALANTKKESK